MGDGESHIKGPVTTPDKYNKMIYNLVLCLPTNKLSIKTDKK